MLCERCEKKTATVYYTDIQEGKLTQYHLCKDCAQEMGISHSAPSQEFPISNFLAGMLEEVDSDEALSPGSHCETCGLAYSEFKELGKLGCSSCYASFSPSLKHLLRRIHGSNQHEGKVPSSQLRLVAERREVRRLKDDLRKAVEEEEFERAAEIRDQLKALESKSGPSSEG